MAQMNSTGKIIRVILGIAIAGIGIFCKSWWGALGALPILGAMTGRCPLCSVFNKSKCNQKS